MADRPQRRRPVVLAPAGLVVLLGVAGAIAAGLSGPPALAAFAATVALSALAVLVVEVFDPKGFRAAAMRRVPRPTVRH